MMGEQPKRKNFPFFFFSFVFSTTFLGSTWSDFITLDRTFVQTVYIYIYVYKWQKKRWSLSFVCKKTRGLDWDTQLLFGLEDCSLNPTRRWKMHFRLPSPNKTTWSLEGRMVTRLTQTTNKVTSKAVCRNVSEWDPSLLDRFPHGHLVIKRHPPGFHRIIHSCRISSELRV